METKSFEVLHRSLAGNTVKTASALRETLASLTGSARDRITMLFDEGTFVETGAYVTRRNSEFEDNAAEELEGDCFMLHCQCGKYKQHPHGSEILPMQVLFSFLSSFSGGLGRSSTSRTALRSLCGRFAAVVWLMIV